MKKKQKKKTLLTTLRNPVAFTMKRRREETDDRDCKRAKTNYNSFKNIRDEEEYDNILDAINKYEELIPKNISQEIAEFATGIKQIEEKSKTISINQRPKWISEPFDTHVIVLSPNVRISIKLTAVMKHLGRNSNPWVNIHTAIKKVNLPNNESLKLLRINIYGQNQKPISTLCFKNDLNKGFKDTKKKHIQYNSLKPSYFVKVMARYKIQ